MAKFFDQIEPHIAAFIAEQHIFFTATAAPTGRVNISPRPTGCLRILNPNAVAYLDETGSGNETAAHLRQLDRMTIMFCGFASVPMILRLYGHGHTHPAGSAEYDALLKSAFGNQAPPGARQIVRLTTDRVQTSCGYGVPLFDYKAERPTLRRWAEAKGEDGLAAYWRHKNRFSIDGFPTGVPAAETLAAE
ncbi:pyridoxamine 5'-phosphate oxidase family protein [Rhodopila sp.]|jgi:hypothetical protein|uniref:pyridoxamine 5'-phosphate oxidase family protein n=1 Tax=Rhodopila sp. TaxID=2480087 RepID=UPI002C531C53|nr:pyridoxamine 5'-phosphate oxidase family protein [Rhodopila sp.]HVZ08953.1 pyridoxamine 5'-phosphate oxidase family protein [Rhodopila sp.]